jgi:hypothetical protein
MFMLANFFAEVGGKFKPSGATADNNNMVKVWSFRAVN